MEKRFDPMTGKPIQQKPEARFDPMTGKPLQAGVSPKPRKSHKGIAILAAILLVLAIGGGGVFAAFKTGLFMSDSQKVWAAIANTVLDQGRIGEVLQKIKLPDSKYTVNVEMDIPEGYIKVGFASSEKEKQLSGTFSEPGVMEINFIAGLDKEKLQLQVPELSDKVLVYNYKEEIGGYLLEELGTTDMEAFEMINQVLETVNAGGNQKENAAEEVLQEFSEEIIKEGKSLKFEEAAAQEFEVDGKEVKCKGYKTTLRSDNVINVINAAEELIVDNYNAIFGGVLEESLDISYAEMLEGLDDLDDLREEYRYMPDVDMAFYLAKGKLACIRMESEGVQVDLLFLGGETRMQNMKMVGEGETLLEVKGESQGSSEYIEIILNEYEAMNITYDHESGSYSIYSRDGEFDLNGTLKADKNGWEISLEDPVIEDTPAEGKFLISVEKGASIEKLSGEKINLGNASEEEFEALESEIEDAMLSSFYW